MSLSESCIEALRKIGDMVLPAHINVKDIMKNIGGYNKQKVIEQMIEWAKEDALMTRIKLFNVWIILGELEKNGGLLSDH